MHLLVHLRRSTHWFFPFRFAILEAIHGSVLRSIGGILRFADSLSNLAFHLEADDNMTKCAEGNRSPLRIHQTDALRKHAFAVESAMRAYAMKMGGDEEVWGAIGILHDFDYDDSRSFRTILPTARRS